MWFIRMTYDNGRTADTAMIPDDVELVKRYANQRLNDPKVVKVSAIHVRHEWPKNLGRAVAHETGRVMARELGGDWVEVKP